MEEESIFEVLKLNSVIKLKQFLTNCGARDNIHSKAMKQDFPVQSGSLALG